MINVECKMQTYNDSLEIKDMPKIHIQSHWNRNSMVWVLVDGKKHLVDAQDMIEAIKNCKNINRY